MKVTALGTNGWFDTETGQTMCTLIQTEDYSVILDAGFGIRKIMGIVDFTKPVYIFLSHLHYDHTVGLHLLDYFPFEYPVKFIIPDHMSEYFYQMGRSPYTANWTTATPKGIEVYEVSRLAEAGLPFEVTTLPLVHPVPDNGYRFEVEGKTVAYLCDTGYCANAVALAKDADLVISECGAFPGTVKENWPHMEPNICAKLAVEANAKQMLLTHFSAAQYPTLAVRLNAVASARGIFKNLITGIDGLEIVL